MRTKLGSLGFRWIVRVLIGGAGCVAIWSRQIAECAVWKKSMQKETISWQKHLVWPKFLSTSLQFSAFFVTVLNSSTQSSHEQLQFPAIFLRGEESVCTDLPQSHGKRYGHFWNYWRWVMFSLFENFFSYAHGVSTKGSLQNCDVSAIFFLPPTVIEQYLSHIQVKHDKTVRYE